MSREDSAPRPGQKFEAHASDSAEINMAGRDINITKIIGLESGKASRDGSKSAAEVSPYPTAMAAFTAEDAEWFFGREQLTVDLTEILDERWRSGSGPIIVTGPSGAGKSSLLQAGLIPKLDEGALPGARNWPRVLTTPTRQPFHELRRNAPESVANQLTTDPRQCAANLRQLLHEEEASRPEKRLVVIVDQFEELFTLCDDDNERKRYLELLAHLSERGPDGQAPVALVVYGLRVDFYSHCVAQPGMRKALQGRQVVVGPMSRDELRDAIVRPAGHAELGIEAGLVDLLFRDLGVKSSAKGDNSSEKGVYEPGRLPLLAHALRATWRVNPTSPLTIEAYNKAGGIEKAVRKDAEDAFTLLSPDARREARNLFLRLIKMGDGTEDTRRRLLRMELIPETEKKPQKNRKKHIQEALAQFTNVRLITQEQDTVEITHEALLWAWPRLRRWIDDDRSGNLLLQEVEEAAGAWVRNGRDTGFLHRRNRLKKFRNWARKNDYDLTPLAEEFIDESTRKANRNLALQGAAVFGVISAMTATIYATNPKEPRELIDECNRNHAAPYQQARSAASPAVAEFGSCSWPPPPGAGEDGFSAVTVTDYAIPDAKSAQKYTKIHIVESSCTRLLLRYRFQSQGTITQNPITVDNDQIVSVHDGSPVGIEAIPPELEGAVYRVFNSLDDSPGRHLIVMGHNRYRLTQAECIQPSA